jgi:hypothetical protein
LVEAAEVDAGGGCARVTAGEASAPGGREFVGEGIGGEGQREERERRRRMVEDGLRSFVLSGQWVRESAGHVRGEGSGEVVEDCVHGMLTGGAWQCMPSVVTWLLVGVGSRGKIAGEGGAAGPAVVGRKDVKRAWEEVGTGGF